MLISYNWLKDFADIKITPEELAERLTMAGIEIGSIEKLKDDFIMDAEITPNRPDLLSMEGIAREAACLTESSFRELNAESCEAENSGESIEVKIQVPAKCLRYNATLIRDAKVKISDEKITRRLSTLGLRPVNNIVDITNYFLLASGQPLHAFDYDKIEGSTVVVRWAKKGESIAALDSREYKLDEDILVIADEKKPIAIAGIIGGIDTEIGYETKNVLLECAHFDPVVIRRAARRLGISTDSSYRFERGVCMETIPAVARKAALLIAQSAKGSIKGRRDIFEGRLKERSGKLRIDEISRILGFKISLDKVKRILTALGFEVTAAGERSLTFKIPFFRQDVSREIDIIEEVARVYGYDKMPTTLARISPKQIKKYRSSAGISEFRKYKIKKMARDILSDRGLNEVITYSMISEKSLSKFNYLPDEIVKVQKALSVEQEILRPTLIPGILNVLSWNLNRQVEDLMIFELGDVFLNKGGKFSEGAALAIGLSGSKFANDWRIKSKPFDFFDLKGIVENLFSRLGIKDIVFKRVDSGIFVKGRSAVVTMADKKLAVLGKVESAALDTFDIEDEVYAAEVYLEEVLLCVRLVDKVKPIPKFPAVTRDLAVIVKNDLSSSEIIKMIKKTGKGLIREVALFDVYSGKQIPTGYKSLAYSIKYQSEKTTLTDPEVDKVQTEIQKTLVNNLKAQMR
ncbi:MAG: phenylalanine--tRNA ligase subunit beta [Candidatus Omnitrophica bacterium]|nr:phenylalanine--tRNA ligase subunit beta [Candidatus Omnitrophota bacterium]